MIQIVDGFCIILFKTSTSVSFFPPNLTKLSPLHSLLLDAAMSDMHAVDNHKRLKVEQHEQVNDVEFTAWAKAPRLGQKPCPTIMDYLLQCVCQSDEAILNRLMTLWACKYQRPKQKLGSIIVLRSEPGAASTIIQLHERISRGRLQRLTKINEITSRFIGRLNGVLWAVVDENMTPGDRNYTSLVVYLCATDNMVYERRLQSQPLLVDIMLTACTNWFALSDDRRISVFDVEPLSANGAASFLAAFDAEAPEFLHVLLHWPIPKNFHIA